LLGDLSNPPGSATTMIGVAVRPNQSMKPTAPDLMTANVFATDPARGLSLSR
jgi:hypothetical protein